MRYLILLLFLLQGCEELQKAIPEGIYHSASAIKTDTAQPVIDETNDLAHVDGSLVKVTWELLHTAPNTFDFSLIEREIDLANQYDTQFTLVITDSHTMPQFVKDACETFDYYSPKKEEPLTTCLPWDLEYLKYKAELVTELGRRFDLAPQLRAVYITYSAMGNGAEMHFNLSDEEYQNFIEAGYTEDRLVESYNAVTDMYADAFISTPLIMEIHTVFDSDYLALNAFIHCYDRKDKYCGVGIWWCSQKNAENAESNVFYIAEVAGWASFSVCQTVNNFTSGYGAFEYPTPIEAALGTINYFKGYGVTTFEIWTKDLENPELIPILEAE